MAIVFADLAGFVRFTEEEGEDEALDLLESFIVSVEDSLPTGARVVKNIGDGVMIVGPDPVVLTDWAIEFQEEFEGALAPAHRDPLRQDPLPGWRLLRAQRQPGGARRGARPRRRGAGHGHGPATAPAHRCGFEPIGEVQLKGIPEPTELFLAQDE